jgi:SEC-C motif domain protein
MPKIVDSAPCPCGSLLSYRACCQPLHSGLPAQTAEQLMRSRYSAYVLENLDYIKKTWHPEHVPADLAIEQSNWIGLKVKESRLGQANDEEGWVRFVARYKINGKAHKMEEHSYFVKIESKWVYVNGT